MACPPRPILDRIVEKFEVAENGCWLWTASKTKNGYGKIGVGGKFGGWKLAYLALWEQVVGPVEEGLELDHLCKTPACINPDHLEPVTHAENMRRALKKTHCNKGHKFTIENSYIYSYGRRCKTCQLKRSSLARGGI